MMRQQWLVFLPVTLATAGLAACASMLGGEGVKVRPVDTMQTLTTAPHDALYESAVSAINERDYGRALDYLQAAKAKDPHNVKALNALGVVYDKLGRFDLSARYYSQARAIEPDSKIVADNMGYSRVLQRLMDPGAPTGVATIDLPPNLTASAAIASTPAAGAAPKAQKPAIVASVEPAPVAPAPVAPAAPQPPRNPFVAAPAIAAFTPDAAGTDSIPIPMVIPVSVRADVKPTAVSASSILAGLATPVIAKPEVADSTPPATVMPVVLPVERKVASPLRLASATPVAVSASSILPGLTTPVIAKPEEADHAPPPTVMPVALPAERKVAAPLLIASATPVPLAPVFPAVPAPTPTAPVAETKPVLASVTPEITAPPPAPPMERKVAAPSVMPKFAVSALLPTLKPEIMPAMAATAAGTPVVVASPTTRPVVIAPVSPARPAAEKKIGVAPIHAAYVTPSKPPATKPVMRPPAALAKTLALLPVAHAQPLAKAPMVKTVPVKPAATKIASANSLPAKSALVKLTPVKAAPVKLAAIQPVSPAPMNANRVVANKKFLTIGQPVRLLNASGKAGGAGPVLRRLAVLGWTMRQSEGRTQPATVLYYPVQNIGAAKALQRTLPFPVRLAVDKAGAMRLVIGRDYLSWKPKNAHIAALWLKSAVVASLQKPSIRGVR